MSGGLWSKPLFREAMRLVGVGVPAALVVSGLWLYALLNVGGLDAFSRSVALAASLPLVLCAPLLVWVAVERARLGKARRALNRVAGHDPVTDVLRGPLLAEIVDRRGRTAAGGAFLIVDASRLGAINRTYGFEWYDEALRHVATAIRGAIRATDLVARTEADAFGVFLGGADAEDALEVGERIRAAVSASYFAPESMRDTIDVTVAGVTFDGEVDFMDLYIQAQRVLDELPEGRRTTLAIARREGFAQA